MEAIRKNKSIAITILFFLLAVVGVIIPLLKEFKYAAGLVFAVLLICFSPIFLTRPHILFFVLITTIPFGFLTLIIPYLTVQPILGFILTAFWLINLFGNRANIYPAKEYKYLIALATVIFISALFGTDFTSSLLYLKTIFMLLFLTFLTINIIDTPKKLYQLGWILILSISVPALLVIVDKSKLLPIQFTGLAFRYGYLGLERVVGTVYDPNYFALQTSVGVSFALTYFFYEKKSIRKLLLLFLSLILLSAILLTFSLGGLIGLTTILLLALFLNRRLRVWQKIAIISILIVAGFLIISFTAYRTRIEDELKLIKHGEVWQLASERVLAWVASVNLIIHKPLLGVGIGQSQFQLKYYDPWDILESILLQEQFKISHNLWLSFTADNGLIALGLLLILMFGPLRTLYAQLKAQRKLENLSESYFLGLSIFVAYVSYIIQNITLDAWTEKYFWLLIGLCICYNKFYKKNEFQN